MKALQLTQSIPRFLLSKALAPVYPSIYWSPLAVLGYRDVPDPELPGADWVKVRTIYGGICGSDMNAIKLNDSLALTTLTSFPFTLGHENVGVIEQVGEAVVGFETGDRVIVDPLLPCVTRGIDPPCEYCQRGDYHLCQNFAEGDLAPGLSIGHCRDTGGSWSAHFVAHKSQIYKLPPAVSDENAVMVDAFCTTLHPVLQNFPLDDDTVLILGAGVVGISTVIALRILGSKARVIVTAKYPFQAEMARKYGADEVILLGEDDLYETIAERCGGKIYQPVMGKQVMVGGADIVYECVGNAGSLDDSLRLARSGGKVVLIGLASLPKGVDWTPIWLNELTLRGSFWCATETADKGRVRTYQMTLDWIEEGKLDLAPLVTHRFRLEDYKKALSITNKRGTNNVIKSVFIFKP